MSVRVVSETPPETFSRVDREDGDAGVVVKYGITVGVRYRVTLADCCISGEFIAALTRIEIGYRDDSERDDSPTALEFSNGVRLTRFGQVEFRECPA